MLSRVLVAAGIIGATAFVSFWVGVWEGRRQRDDERISARVGERVRREQDTEKGRVWN